MNDDELVREVESSLAQGPLKIHENVYYRGVFDYSRGYIIKLRERGGETEAMVRFHTDSYYTESWLPISMLRRSKPKEWGDEEDEGT